MRSPVISDSRRQLTLELDETLLDRHGSLRDCLAQVIYSRGLKKVAGELNLSPGNLSVALSEDTARKFGIDELEAYIKAFGDKTPIYYLIAKYLGDEGAVRDHALHQVVELLQRLPALADAAGLQAARPKRER
jgi:hypothetical protein